MKDNWYYLLLVSDAPLNRGTDVHVGKQNQVIFPIVIDTHVLIFINSFRQAVDQIAREC